MLRGLHYQIGKYSQAKLVKVLRGKVLDVAVDIRPDSPSYLKYTRTILDSKRHESLFIPKSFAHGYVVLSENALYSYKVDEIFSIENMRGISFDSKLLNIDWKISINKLILSDKDRMHPELPL